MLTRVACGVLACVTAYVDPPVGDGAPPDPSTPPPQSDAAAPRAADADTFALLSILEDAARLKDECPDAQSAMVSLILNPDSISKEGRRDFERVLRVVERAAVFSRLTRLSESPLAELLLRANADPTLQIDRFGPEHSRAAAWLLRVALLKVHLDMPPSGRGARAGDVAAALLLYRAALVAPDSYTMSQATGLGTALLTWLQDWIAKGELPAEFLAELRPVLLRFRGGWTIERHLDVARVQPNADLDPSPDDTAEIRLEKAAARDVRHRYNEALVEWWNAPAADRLGKLRDPAEIIDDAEDTFGVDGLSPRFVRGVLNIPTLHDGLLLSVCVVLAQHSTGKWPGTLEELVPEFLPALPQDSLSHGPFGYKVEGDAVPVLYSYGADCHDDGANFGHEPLTHGAFQFPYGRGLDYWFRLAPTWRRD